MQEYTKTFGTWQWYTDVYHINEDGTTTDGTPIVARASTGPDDDGVDEEAPEEVEEKVAALAAGGCSTYQCYSKLVSFCTQLMKNSLEPLMCKLSQNYVPGKTLDLSTGETARLREILEDIEAKYNMDFPPETQPRVAHKITHTVGDEGDKLEVTTVATVESVDEYKAQLALFNERAAAHEADSIKEFIDTRIVLMVDALEPNKTRIADRLHRLPLLREKKRKLYVYDVNLDGPLNWTKIKKRGLSVWSGSGPGLCKQRLEARGRLAAAAATTEGCVRHVGVPWVFRVDES